MWTLFVSPNHQLQVTERTRSTQRAQTSAEHGMTQLVNDVSITLYQKSVCNFLSNPEDPDFGLWTPGSEA